MSNSLDELMQDESRKMAALLAQISAADKPLHDMLRDESERMTALLARIRAADATLLDTYKKAGDASE
jgi:hypothetical protein